MGSDSSSDSSSSEDDKRKKKDKKKGKRADKKPKKKDKKGKEKKVKKKGSKKRKASSSSDSSSSAKKGKKAKRGADNDEVLQEKWISTRQKAIRKADPGISKDDALKRAVEEYTTIFAAEVAEVDVPDVNKPRADDEDDPLLRVEDGPVADAAAEAERQAREDGQKAGLSQKEIEAEMWKARVRVIKVAEQAGMYKAAEPDTLFLKQIKWEEAEAKRFAAFVPSTDDAATQLARNAAAASRAAAAKAAAT
mmetsp:Transcript_58376/g.125428  ORF Transcript_58376/g.125428 Transcript_58376/m.125428 type:complete len:250 (+) Transcript_58376:86-835(+)